MFYSDMHIDTLHKLLYEESKEKRYLGLYENGYQVDIKKLQKANYAAQFFACFIDIGKEAVEGSHFNDTLTMIDIFYKGIKSHGSLIKHAANLNDYKNNMEKGIISGFLSTEGGGQIEGEIDNLDTLKEKGVFMFGLTWNHENEIGFPNYKWTNADKGLKKFGIEVLEKCDDLGMVLDVSHLSDGGFYDLINYGKRPFMASHSNCREICNNPRNLDDAMIKKLADKGGVMGLNFLGLFLEEHQYDSNGKCYDIRSTIDSMIMHIKHAINIGGEDIIVLGTDFDGMPRQRADIKAASEMYKLSDALERAGFKSDQIENICYRNFEKFLDRYEN